MEMRLMMMMKICQMLYKEPQKLFLISLKRTWPKHLKLMNLISCRLRSLVPWTARGRILSRCSASSATPSTGRGIIEEDKEGNQNDILESALQTLNEINTDSDREIMTKFEERVYLMTMFACTTKKLEERDPSMDTESRDMFQKLYSYIQ